MELEMYEALVAGTLRIEDLKKRTGTEDRVGLLEAKLLEAEAVIVMAQQAVGVDHPAWVVLDDYDGSMDSLKELVADNARLREALADQLADSAQLIRDELVCCDIYERLLSLYTADGNPTYEYRTLRASHEYHPICHYGEWAARIVEKGGRAQDPPGRVGTAWELAQRVIELEEQLRQRDAEIRMMEQERRWTER